ncbi:hypothetical protein [Ligaoa zhengdingensis]|jgi:hypothetical protein|uniref:hypothetical protein n=1 Tax=Ligaoa zhengdingensis TaxID=2763658 RepID=UPI0031BAAFA2
MDYSFNGEIATIYGVDEAVFIHNLYWWIRKNEVNGRHHYDGKTWTYNSILAWSELFPFWTKDKVRRICERLEKNGAIYVGSYNKNAFDRTKWYALSEDIIAIYERQSLQANLLNKPNGIGKSAKCTNGNFAKCTIGKSATPIPDNIPDNIPDIKGRFVRPTVEEVKEYCFERGNGIDPVAFVDHYEAKGWKIGKSPMKDWKAAVRTWESREEKREVRYQMLD